MSLMNCPPNEERVTSVKHYAHFLVRIFYFFIILQ